MKLYRIGELAELANVSPRTIDYYTTLGVIRPEKRSRTNYRLYGDETLQRLKRIEELKREKYSLEEIKSMLDLLSKGPIEERVKEKVADIQMHLMQLEREAKELAPMLSRLKPTQQGTVFRRLTPQAAACMEALLLLMDKGPIM